MKKDRQYARTRQIVEITQSVYLARASRFEEPQIQKWTSYVYESLKCPPENLLFDSRDDVTRAWNIPAMHK